MLSTAQDELQGQIPVTSMKGTDAEGARLLTHSIMPTVSPACRLCINIHHYAPPRIVRQHCSPLRWTLRYTPVKF